MPFISALGRQRQGDLCEFEAILVSRASARIGSKATQRNPVSKNKNKKRKEKKKKRKKESKNMKIPGKQSSHSAIL